MSSLFGARFEAIRLSILEDKGIGSGRRTRSFVEILSSVVVTWGWSGSGAISAFGVKAWSLRIQIHLERMGVDILCWHKGRWLSNACRHDEHRLTLRLERCGDGHSRRWVVCLQILWSHISCSWHRHYRHWNRILGHICYPWHRHLRGCWHRHNRHLHLLHSLLSLLGLTCHFLLGFKSRHTGRELVMLCGKHLGGLRRNDLLDGCLLDNHLGRLLVHYGYGRRRYKSRSCGLE